jgi:hypothetical protein
LWLRYWREEEGQNMKAEHQKGVVTQGEVQGGKREEVLLKTP